MKGLHVIAEALARMEHKIDAIVRTLNIKSVPMHFLGQSCPICSKPIDYQVDIGNQVVVRKCGCSSGKIAAMSPISGAKDESNSNSTITK